MLGVIGLSKRDAEPDEATAWAMDILRGIGFGCRVAFFKVRDTILKLLNLLAISKDKSQGERDQNKPRSVGPRRLNQAQESGNNQTATNRDAEVFKPSGHKFLRLAHDSTKPISELIDSQAVIVGVDVQSDSMMIGVEYKQ